MNTNTLCLGQKARKSDFYTYPGIANGKVFEAVFVKMSRLFVGAVADFRHLKLTLESTPDSIVNTFWLPPVSFQTDDTVALVTEDFLRLLFDNFRM